MSSHAKEKKSYFGIEIEDVKQALADLEELQVKMRSGFLEKLMGINPESNAALRDLLGDKYDADAAQERMGNVLKRVLGDGLLLKDAIGLSAQSMEAFYYLGYCLFQGDRLPESFQLFKMLCALDPTQWKYFYALAAVLHKQRNYSEAAKHYIIATTLHPQENFPLGHFHSADCYAGLEDLTSAVVSLGMAIETCDDAVQEHRDVRAKARDLKDIFTEQLRHEDAKGKKTAETASQ